MRAPPTPEQLARNKRLIIVAAAIIFGSIAMGTLGPILEEIVARAGARK